MSGLVYYASGFDTETTWGSGGGLEDGKAIFVP